MDSTYAPTTGARCADRSSPSTHNGTYACLPRDTQCQLCAGCFVGLASASGFQFRGGPLSRADVLNNVPVEAVQTRSQPSEPRGETRPHIMPAFTPIRLPAESPDRGVTRSRITEPGHTLFCSIRGWFGEYDGFFSRPRRAPRTHSNMKEARRDGPFDNLEYDLVRAVL